MSKKTNKYTVSVYTEDSVGLLNRISAIFQRRHINIESFNSSMTEIESVQRWTILILTTEVQIKKIVGQINRQIEVIKAYYHTDEETIYQESCLFKIKSMNEVLQLSGVNLVILAICLSVLLEKANLF